jgi:hypothetical protein
VSPSLARNIGYASFFALVAIVLAGYLLFPRVIKPHSGALIAGSNLGHIERIEISRQGHSYAIVLKRIDGAWKLAIDPDHEYPARTDRITTLLQALSGRRTLAPVGLVDEKKIGIGTEGSYSIRVIADGNSKNGQKGSSILFGDIDATGKWMYAKQEPDGRVFRTESDIAAVLDVRAASWAKLAVFSETLAKTGIQRVVFLKNCNRRQFLAGKDSAISGFESALARLECLDVTNLESPETESLEIEFGDLKNVRIGLAPLGDVWILNDSETGGSYVISDETKRALEAPLEID